MSQSFTNLLYHIIFSTKDRRPIITLDHQTRLYEYIGGVVRGTGGISLGINGMEDHVHLWPNFALIEHCLTYYAS